ncbi:putative holin [Paucibacter sp. O1-1]|nr:putative holin [Paucibacter sp. O1-1]MDA3826588.1 putative holin [Paucibacter sp. O1-1]
MSQTLDQRHGQQRPRMLAWIGASVALMLLAHVLSIVWPSGLLAVTTYKAHLLALGGWGGYWLDRGLFPYDRPHRYFDDEPEPAPPAADYGESICTGLVTTSHYGYTVLRRAIIVAACLVCVGLGA